MSILYYAETEPQSPAVEASEKKWGRVNFAENAGLDVYGVGPVVLWLPSLDFLTQVNFATIISTNLAFQPPRGVHLDVGGRSGLGFKYGITPFNGTIDFSYRGEVKILLRGSFYQTPQVRYHRVKDENGKEWPRSGFYKITEAGYLHTVFGDTIYVCSTASWEDYVTYNAEFTNQMRSRVATPTAIAQLRFLNYAGINLASVWLKKVSWNELQQSVRGKKGFGSSG